MIMLVTGGSKSGKSTYAENVCAQLGGDLIYLAAMVPYGEEAALRVKRHRDQRAGKGFTTIECFEGFQDLWRDERLDDATALLECLGNIVANEQFAYLEGIESSSSEKGVNPALDFKRVESHLHDALERLMARCAHLVVVGNEVGADGVEYTEETRCYQELVGAIAHMLAQRADVVVEVSAGFPCVLKGDFVLESSL